MIKCGMFALANSSHAHRCFQMTVTYQVGGGGHLDIDFWVSKHILLLALLAPLSVCRADQQSRRECNTKEHQVLDGYRVHHRGEGWSARVLLLQPNERNCG